MLTTLDCPDTTLPTQMTPPPPASRPGFTDEDVLAAHRGGKLSIELRSPLVDKRDLSMMYTPGVAGVSSLIAREPAAAREYTWASAAVCIPEGLPRLMTIRSPFEILQRTKAVYFVAQNRLPWKAFFNEKLPEDPDPFYLGYHVAKWDGPALVIDSSGFRDSTVLDDKGLPHGEKLHLTQTLKLAPGGKTMTVTYRIEDPEFYTRPWTATASFAKKPDSFQFPEEVCAEKLQSTAPKR